MLQHILIKYTLLSQFHKYWSTFITHCMANITNVKLVSLLINILIYIFSNRQYFSSNIQNCIKTSTRSSVNIHPVKNIIYISHFSIIQFFFVNFIYLHFIYIFCQSIQKHFDCSHVFFFWKTVLPSFFSWTLVLFIQSIWYMSSFCTLKIETFDPLSYIYISGGQKKKRKKLVEI